MEPNLVKEPEWDKIFFNWLPEKQRDKYLRNLEKDINLSPNYFFLKGIQYEFGIKKKINQIYSLEFYQQGMQKNNFLCYYRFYFLYFQGNSDFKIEKNDDISMYFLIKACAYYNPLDKFIEEINPLLTLNTKFSKTTKEKMNSILKNLFKSGSIFLVEDIEINYLTSFFKAYYYKWKDQLDEEASDTSEEEDINVDNKKDYFEKYIYECANKTFHKEAINQIINYYINNKENKKLIHAVKLFKNFANLKFYGLLWNYLYTYSTNPEFEAIYQELSGVIKIKLKFYQNYRLYGDYYSSQDSFFNNNKKINKMIELYYKSILEGNINCIPQTLLYLIKYFKQDLDDISTSNYKLFKDIVEIINNLFFGQVLESKHIITYISIGIAYSRLFINGSLEKDFKKAIVILEKCLEALTQAQNEDFKQENLEEYNYYLFLLNYYIGKSYKKIYKHDKCDEHFKQNLEITKFINKSEIYYKLGRMYLFGWGVEINYNDSYAYFVKSKELLTKNFTINNNFYSQKSSLTILNRIEFKKKIEEEKKCFNICHICQKNEKKTLAIPCGHKYSCELCYDNQNINSKRDLKCESCEGTINSVIKVFY